ncbi:MAG: hypothetical protein FWG10_10770 [Eubacteriaceae bacterium]|nr:hypothetical protein [Eubacteriaceae bacterium]
MDTSTRQRPDNENIKEFWVDEENNRVVVGIVEDDKAGQTKKELLSALGEGMVSFVKSDPQDEIKLSATIHGTSKIYKRIDSQYISSSTPAGKMYSASKNMTGVIACGHGYSRSDIIYTGNETRIGIILDHKLITTYGSWNDSSFIGMEYGHSYTGTKNDMITTQTPVVNSNITLRGHYLVTKSAKVTSTNATCTTLIPLISMGNLIKADKPISLGDSGGGAIGGTADGGQTNLIIGINHAANSWDTWLVKGGTVYNGFK